MIDWAALSALQLPNSRLITTVLVLALVLVLRSVALRRIGETSMIPEQKRRWILQVRNLAWVVLVFALVAIWGDEIRGFALSLVAFLAALVLATKELILCVTGSILKAGSNSFKIGDRIEVSSIRGEVVDHNFLTTTLIEIGPGPNSHQRTGRRLVIPNSMFLSQPVINETFSHQYVLHLFTVPMKRKQDWARAERTLLEAARRASAEYLEEARALMEEISRRQGLETSRAEPRVTIQFSGAEDITLLVRLAVPVSEKGQIEQAILRAYADSLLEERKEAGADEESKSP